MGIATQPAAAVRALHKSSSDAIAKAVMNIVKDRDETDDVMQEAWVRYLRAEDNDEQVEIENPMAFLRRIAVNLALDRLRYRQRRKLIFAEIPSNDHIDALAHVHGGHDNAEDRVEYSITIGKVMHELVELPPKCRKAFMLSIFEGHTHLEVSRDMGMSVSMIEKYCRRALENVRANVPNIFAQG